MTIQVTKIVLFSNVFPMRIPFKRNYSCHRALATSTDVYTTHRHCLCFAQNSTYKRLDILQCAGDICSRTRFFNSSLVAQQTYVFMLCFCVWRCIFFVVRSLTQKIHAVKTYPSKSTVKETKKDALSLVFETIVVCSIQNDKKIFSFETWCFEQLTFCVRSVPSSLTLMLISRKWSSFYSVV